MLDFTFCKYKIGNLKTLYSDMKNSGEGAPYDTTDNFVLIIFSSRNILQWFALCKYYELYLR